ncbi:MAG: DUF1800 domain-containing protein, partial [Capsulimonas sp.]|uniref:DUF1800 domain-containing protein n=1 Tax=Capsulimonas sp. TaxID=2494211 RepID=UPI003264CA01
MALSQIETAKMGHLLRRAGFGARPEEWETYARLGVAGTTDALLHPERAPDRLAALLKEIDGDFVDFHNMDSVKMWWLYRIAHTQRPLEEKMTLFWHNHFATANYKVDNPGWMWKQNELFRTQALGNFRTMLKAVSRDPAMLVWLDGSENRKGKPNENYGRELLELFTMGVHGGYTEQDVKEAARAFTGWRLDRDASTFSFDAGQHDDGPKTFLGQTGNFNGDDIIDIVARHPSTARFLCTKLYKFFIDDNPTPASTAPFEKVYFNSGYDIRSVVGAMLTSSAFYSATAMYSKIKSPVEMVMTTVRTMDVPMSALNYLPGTLRSMGQDLFNPPNVKGWTEGQTWMNTMTLMARVNFINQVVREMGNRGDFSERVHGALARTGMPVTTPDGAVDAVWAAFMPGRRPSAPTRAALIAYASDGWKPGEVRFENKSQGLVR